MHFLSIAVTLVFFSSFLNGAYGYFHNDVIGVKDPPQNLSMKTALKLGLADYPTWPGGKIPYEIGTGFSATDISNLNIAFADYAQKTCLQWVQRQGEANYVKFSGTSGSGCASTGNGGGCYRAGETPVAFETCRQIDVMIHEFGHVICYGHEQDRFDSDTYVGPKIANCSPNGKGTLSNHLYDYLSVMHYECDDQCLSPKLSGVPYCGQRYDGGRLSILDAEKVNDLYNCEGCKSYRFRLPSLTSPAEAFAAGMDINGGTTYICRAYANGHIVVGTASSPLTGCWVPNAGAEIGMSSGFEVLTNPESANLVWVEATGKIPAGAIPGGRSSTHETVYIGRCNLNVGGLISLTIGKVMASRPSEVLVPFGGAEHSCNTFEFLVCE